MEIKSEGKGEIRAVCHTDRNGKFGLKAAPLKRYELSVGMAGFKRAVKTVDVGSVRKFDSGDIVLPVGDASIIDVIQPASSGH